MRRCLFQKIQTNKQRFPAKHCRKSSGKKFFTLSIRSRICVIMSSFTATIFVLNLERQTQALFPQPIALKAGPSIIRGVINQACSYRVEIDISITAQAITLAVDYRTLKPTFPQRSASAIGLVDVSNVASAERLHRQ